MARVTATEVKTIMDNCTVSDTIVDEFIATGTLVVTNTFVSNTTITADTLKKIEQWFVAHMIASTIDRQTSEEKLGDATIKYTGKWGTDLDSTSYGQMVKIIDTTGKMANISKKAATTYAVKSFTTSTNT